MNVLILKFFPFFFFFFFFFFDKVHFWESVGPEKQLIKFELPIHSLILYFRVGYFFIYCYYFLLYAMPTSDSG